MRQAISGKDLCRFGRQSKVLQSLRSPTPEGWLQVVKSERDAELNGYFLASPAEVREATFLMRDTKTFLIHDTQTRIRKRRTPSAFLM